MRTAWSRILSGRDTSPAADASITGSPGTRHIPSVVRPIGSSRRATPPSPYIRARDYSASCSGTARRAPPLHRTARVCGKSTATSRFAREIDLAQRPEPSGDWATGRPVDFSDTGRLGVRLIGRAFFQDADARRSPQIDLATGRVGRFPAGPGKPCVPKAVLPVACRTRPIRVNPLDPRNRRTVLAVIFHRPCCSQMRWQTHATGWSSAR